MEKNLFVTKLTDAGDIDLEGVGVIRRDEDGNVYRYVRNTSGGTLTAKQAVCYDVSNNAGDSDFLQEVTDPATANLMAFAGLAMVAAEDDEYFWIKIKGVEDDAVVDVPVTTAIAVGDFLMPSNSNEHLGEDGNSIVAAGTAPTYPYGSVAMEEVKTASTGSTTTAQVNVIGMGA